MADDFENLNIWKNAHRLSLEIYQISGSFPSSERHGLTAQIRRSAASIAANIAESHGLYHYAETIQFIRRARGSLEETRNHLMLARDLHYLSIEKFRLLEEQYIELRKMLNGYIRSMERNKLISTR